MENCSELIYCIMSLISNISFFEKGMLMINDFELNACKSDVLI